MKRTLRKLSAVGLALVALLTACQKEEHPGRLELTAEGMGSGAKMYVDNKMSYWQGGDVVQINGSSYSIYLGGGKAYVDHSFSSDDYSIIFPASIFRRQVGSTVTVSLADTYNYREEYVSGMGDRQVLNAPMAYYGTANSGKVKMKHLTGALNIQLTGPSGIEIDSIIIGTTQNYQLSGEMQMDISDIENIGSSAVSATQNTITMIGGKCNGIVQIPIPVTTGNANYTVTVKAHADGTKYLFNKTQNEGGHLGRGVLGTVPINLNEGQDGVTTSALFLTTVLDGTTYYQINTSSDLEQMSNAINNEWSYNGLKYNEANYILTDDIDMSGINFTSIYGMKGVLNGNGHSINNLHVVKSCKSLSNTRYFGFIAWADNCTLKNLTFNGLVVYPSGMSECSYGALIGGTNTSVTISNVTVTNFQLGTADMAYSTLHVGGFIGWPTGSSTVNISASSISFASGNGGMNTYYTTAYIGGISANETTSSTFNLRDVTINLGSRNFYRDSPTYFGGLMSILSSATVNAEGVLIIGDVTYESNSFVPGKVWSGTNTFPGVNVDYLTIIQN